MTPEELEAELRRLLKDVKPFKPEWSPERIDAAIRRLHKMIDDLKPDKLPIDQLEYDLMAQYERIVAKGMTSGDFLEEKLSREKKKE